MWKTPRPPGRRTPRTPWRLGRTNHPRRPLAPNAARCTRARGKEETATTRTEKEGPCTTRSSKAAHPLKPLKPLCAAPRSPLHTHSPHLRRRHASPAAAHVAVICSRLFRTMRAAESGPAFGNMSKRRPTTNVQPHVERKCRATTSCTKRVRGGACAACVGAACVVWPH